MNLSNIRFQKYYICGKRDFDSVNLVKNEILKM